MQPEWLAKTQAIMARLHDDLGALDPLDLPSYLQQFIDGIDEPADPLHTTALSLMLTDACTQIVQVLHDRGPATGCSCHVTSWPHIRLLTKWDERDPRLVFREWMNLFLDQFAREHPAPAGDRAAALIRADPLRAWTLKDLAREVNTGPVRLRHQFQQRFGMRPSAYVQLVRALRAVVLLKTATKVEGVAWDVGYKSKKDLYTALKRWVGSTPTELRALSDDERSWLERQLRIRCISGTFVGHVSADTQEFRPPAPRRQQAPLPHM
jgi:AraC-like DNA-binding protein